MISVGNLPLLIALVWPKKQRLQVGVDLCPGWFPTVLFLSLAAPEPSGVPVLHLSSDCVQGQKCLFMTETSRQRFDDSAVVKSNMDRCDLQW